MSRDEYVAKLKSQIFKRLQTSSMDAWRDMMQGTDAAFKSMQEAFEKARREFQKK